MEPFFYNHKKLKDRRKELRKDATPVEILLWEKLRRKQLGFKFFRQYSVGMYILDFYCPIRRIAIELDGGHHAEAENKIYDQERTQFLKNLDIEVLRFWNTEVFEDIEKVVKRIKSKL